MLEALTSILILIAFLVPGFVWRTVEAQFIFLDKRLEWEKFALGLLARSTVVYTCAGEVIYQGWKNDWLDVHPIYSTLVAAGFIGVLPAILGFVSGILRQQGFFPWMIKKMGLRAFEQHQIPTAWDYVFSRITPQWAIVTLQDGTKIRGYVGEDSYFSSDMESRDLFISHVIQSREDGKMEQILHTGGVYINKDQVTAIEFLKLK